MHRYLLALFAGLFAQASFAAAIDVSSVVSDVAAQAVPIGLVSGAVLLLMLGIKAYRWLRKLLSFAS